jgi:hypothetical protein
MPKGSCTRTPLDQRLEEGWTVTDDLLALLIEVTSVGVANRQLRKPLEIPRPSRQRKPTAPPTTPAAKDAAFKSGIAVLANSTKAVRR